MRPVPSAAESFDKLHGSGHLLDLNIDSRLLIRKQRGLGRDDVHVGIDARLIPAHFEIQIFFSGFHGIPLYLELSGQDANLGEVILHLLEGRQDILAVGGEIRVLSRYILVDGGSAQSGIEYSLGSRRTDGP